MEDELQEPKKESEIEESPKEDLIKSMAKEMDDFAFSLKEKYGVDICVISAIIDNKPICTIGPDLYQCTKLASFTHKHLMDNIINDIS